PPTQLLAIDDLIAWLAHYLSWRNLGFSLTFTRNHRPTSRQYPLFNPHSVSSSHASLFMLFPFWPLLRNRISSYILLLGEILGIFSHDLCLCGEIFLNLKLGLFAHHGVINGNSNVVRNSFQSQDAVDLAAVGAVADAEMHRAVVFLPLAHGIVVLLAKLVQPHRNFPAHEPGILVAVGFEKPAHLFRFSLALDIHEPAVFDNEGDRM